MAEIQIGDRVVVDGRPGVVRYAGLTEFCSGFWYGVELDNCEGFNDGSVEGKRYFDIQGRQGNYGIFAQAEDLIKVAACVDLKDENLRLISVIEALERKVRQLVLNQSQLSRVSKVNELPNSAQSLSREQTHLNDEQARSRDENRQLRATTKSLEVNQEELYSAVSSPKSENNRLTGALAVATAELNDLKEDNKQHEALQGLYIEIEKELRDQLKILEDYILAEERESCGRSSTVKPNIQFKAAANVKFFDELYAAVFASEQTSLQLLELQYDFLRRIFASAQVDLSIQDRLMGQVYFLVLCELAKLEYVKCSDQCFDMLRKGFGNNGAIINGLLLGHAQSELLHFPELISFLEISDAIYSNSELVISMLSSICGTILPQLLSYYRKKDLPYDMLATISNVYSVVVSIEEHSTAFAENMRLHPGLPFMCDLSLSKVLELALSLIRYEPGSDNSSLEAFKMALEDVLACLDQSESDLSSKLAHNALESVPSTDVLNVESRKFMETDQSSEITFLRAELSEKEAKEQELMIKIQLLEKKIEESCSRHNALPVNEESARELPNMATEDDKMLEEQSVTASNTNDIVLIESPPTQTFTTEIIELQRVVASLTKHRSKEPQNFGWLSNDKESAIVSSVNANLKNQLHDLTTSAIEAAEDTKVVNYQNGSSEKQKNYILNATFKQNVLNLKIKNVSV